MWMWLPGGGWFFGGNQRVRRSQCVLLAVPGWPVRSSSGCQRVDGGGFWRFHWHLLPVSVKLQPVLAAEVLTASPQK